MNPEISRQHAHDLLEALLLCRSARDEVRGLETVIAQYEAKLAEEEPKRAIALARRGEFLAGMNTEVASEDDGALIAMLEAYKEADEACRVLTLTIAGQRKLLTDAEKRLQARLVDRSQIIALINAER